MRRLTAILLVLVFSFSAYGQKQPDKKTDAKGGTTTTVKKDEKKTDAASADKKETAPATEEKIEKLPEGYANLTWGTYLSDAKDKISGILTFTDDKKVIVSREGDLEYYYGFFYREPEPSEKKPIEKPADTKDTTATTGTDTTGTTPPEQKEQEKDEGKLFYVSLNFPYLDKDVVYEKIKKKYGTHTGETIKDNQGAIAWDSEKTVVLMWVDRYGKKPYCRRVIYISKDISKELNAYTNTIFNKTEIDLIKKLNP